MRSTVLSSDRSIPLGFLILGKSKSLTDRDEHNTTTHHICTPHLPDVGLTTQISYYEFYYGGTGVCVQKLMR